MNNRVDSSKSQVIQDEIEGLEKRLEDAKARLNAASHHGEVKQSRLIHSDSNIYPPTSFLLGCSDRSR